MHAGMAGPLKGIRIVELGGIGPAPFAAMMLADHGAEVIRVERSGMIGFENDPLRRSRRSISLDLKRPEACEVVRRLAARSDGLLEGYRPGVMERLGLGPDELLKANPGLVYGRVTGWGQDGPLSQEAAAWHRPARAARSADQLSGGLCRRRHDAGVRHGQRASGG